MTGTITVPSQKGQGMDETITETVEPQEQPKYVNSLGADQPRTMAADAKTVAGWIMAHTAPVPISHHNLGYEVGAAVLHIDVCRLLGMPKMAYRIGGQLGYDTEQLLYAETAVHKAAELIRQRSMDPWLTSKTVSEKQT